MIANRERDCVATSLDGRVILSALEGKFVLIGKSTLLWYCWQNSDFLTVAQISCGFGCFWRWPKGGRTKEQNNKVHYLSLTSLYIDRGDIYSKSFFLNVPICGEVDLHQHCLQQKQIWQNTTTCKLLEVLYLNMLDKGKFGQAASMCCVYVTIKYKLLCNPIFDSIKYHLPSIIYSNQNSISMA